MDKIKLMAIGFILIFLQACASSGVSREAANQFNMGYQNAHRSFSHFGDGNFSESFSTSSQTTKGLVIGATAGAIAGSMTSGIGLLPGAAGGAIFGGAIGAYIDSQTTLLDKLENNGVKVFVLGDHVLIVIPSRHLFNKLSANFNPYAFENLNLIIVLINHLPNMTVKVAAYTAPIGSATNNLFLSKAQAERVMRYLWRYGLNTRLLYSVGCGGAFPVEGNVSWNSGDNYRVEISLEKLPA